MKQEPQENQGINDYLPFGIILAHKENQENQITEKIRKSYAMVLDLIQYIFKHRNAKDTLDGVIQWWISSESRFKWRKEEIQATIDFMVSRGWLEVRHVQVPPQRIYAVNKERVEELEAFLVKYENVKN